MLRTKQEKAWLQTLATRVQSEISRGPGRAMLKKTRPTVHETEDYMDGWWVNVARINGAESEFAIFIDNSLGKKRRTFWYGTSSRTKAAVQGIDQVGRRRWPYTQVHLDGASYPASQVRYTDPIIDRYGKDEYYYGWYEEDPPPTSQPKNKSLVNRIVERFNAILAELSGNDSGTNLLSRLDELDGLRNAKVRLEQGILRSFLLGDQSVADCALCGERFPVDLLVAAHIKRRANCTDAERRSYKSNLMAVCTFGCDELFERGYIGVERGHIAAGHGPLQSQAVERKVSHLKGLSCGAWNPKSAPFFEWHRKHVGSDKLDKVTRVKSSFFPPPD
jgi:hypothetical protein